MCLGIFTQYKNKSPDDSVQIHSVYEEFNCTQFQSNVMTSACMFGVLLGNLLVGKFADTYGRRAVALVVHPVSILVACASAIFTVNWQTYSKFKNPLESCEKREFVRF